MMKYILDKNKDVLEKAVVGEGYHDLTELLHDYGLYLPLVFYRQSRRPIEIFILLFKYREK